MLLQQLVGRVYRWRRVRESSAVSVVSAQASDITFVEVNALVAAQAPLCVSQASCERVCTLQEVESGLL